MKHALPAIAALSLLTAFTLPAVAQEAKPPLGFGARAANVLTIDEFAGVYRESISTPSQKGGDDSGVLYVGSHAGLYAINETTRFGYHRFLTPEISLGLGVHYGDRDLTFLGTAVGNGNETTLGVSPRIGFVFAANETGAFWFRFGFDYYHYSFSDDLSAWDFGPGVELFYVYTPFEHFGITFGPTLELGLAGNVDVPDVDCAEIGGSPPTCTNSTSSTPIRRRTFGVAIGFLFDL